MILEILRGDVWLFDPEPTRGREIEKNYDQQWLSQIIHLIQPP